MARPGLPSRIASLGLVALGVGCFSPELVPCPPGEPAPCGTPGRFSDPIPVSELNDPGGMPHEEDDLTLTADGLEIYFRSSQDMASSEI